MRHLTALLSFLGLANQTPPVPPTHHATQVAHVSPIAAPLVYYTSTDPRELLMEIAVYPGRHQEVTLESAAMLARRLEALHVDTGARRIPIPPEWFTTRDARDHFRRFTLKSLDQQHPSLCLYLAPPPELAFYITTWTFQRFFRHHRTIEAWLRVTGPVSPFVLPLFRNVDKGLPNVLTEAFLMAPWLAHERRFRLHPDQNIKVLAASAAGNTKLTEFGRMATFMEWIEWNKSLEKGDGVVNQSVAAEILEFTGV